MEIEERAEKLQQDLMATSDAAGVLQQRGRDVVLRLDQLPQQLGAGGQLPLELQDFIKSEAELRGGEISQAIRDQISALGEILNLRPADTDSEHAYADLHNIAEDVSQLVAGAAGEIGDTLRRSIETCGSRLDSAMVDLADSITRWSEQLADNATDIEGALDGLGAESIQAWTEASEHLNSFVAGEGTDLFDRVAKIQARIEDLSQRIKSSVDVLASAQKTSSAAMAATQGPLEVCLGILDDTRSIFSGV